MIPGRIAPSLACLALLCVSSLGTAQTTSKPAAEALFERGRELLSQQRIREACAKFDASQQIDAGIGTLLYLGDCYERLGRTASAWATFKEAASLAQVRSDERERIATIRASALQPRLSRLILRVPQAHRLQGLSLRIGGTPIPRASWGIGLPVDPGWQRVEASALGHEPWSRSIRVVAGGRAVIDVPRLRLQPGSDRPSSMPAAAVEPTRPEPGAAQRTVALVIGGLGVAGLAAGSVLALQAERKNDASLEHCPSDRSLCSSRGKALRDDALDYAHASTAVFAAGGALLVAAFVVHLSSPSPSRVGTSALAASATIDSARGELRITGGF